MSDDAGRLRYLMHLHLFDYINGVEPDLAGMMRQVARENGRLDPSESDQIEGFRRTLDAGIELFYGPEDDLGVDQALFEPIDFDANDI